MFGFWFASLLTTVVFFILQVAGAIMWSWWLVFLPLMIGFIPVIFAIVLWVLFVTAIRGWV